MSNEQTHPLHATDKKIIDSLISKEIPEDFDLINLGRLINSLISTTDEHNTTSRNGNIGYHFSSPTLAGKKEGRIVKASPIGLTVMKAGNCLRQNSSMVRIFLL